MIVVVVYQCFLLLLLLLFTSIAHERDSFLASIKRNLNGEIKFDPDRVPFLNCFFLEHVPGTRQPVSSSVRRYVALGKAFMCISKLNKQTPLFP